MIAYIAKVSQTNMFTNMFTNKKKSAFFFLFFFFFTKLQSNETIKIWYDKINLNMTIINDARFPLLSRWEIWRKNDWFNYLRPHRKTSKLSWNGFVVSYADISKKNQNQSRRQNRSDKNQLLSYVMSALTSAKKKEVISKCTLVLDINTFNKATNQTLYICGAEIKKKKKARKPPWKFYHNTQIDENR